MEETQFVTNLAKDARDLLPINATKEIIYLIAGSAIIVIAYYLSDIAWQLRKMASREKIRNLNDGIEEMLFIVNVLLDSCVYNKLPPYEKVVTLKTKAMSILPGHLRQMILAEVGEVYWSLEPLYGSPSQHEKETRLVLEGGEKEKMIQHLTVINEKLITHIDELKNMS